MIYILRTGNITAINNHSFLILILLLCFLASNSTPAEVSLKKSIKGIIAVGKRLIETRLGGVEDEISWGGGWRVESDYW